MQKITDLNPKYTALLFAIGIIDVREQGLDQLYTGDWLEDKKREYAENRAVLVAMGNEIVAEMCKRQSFRDPLLDVSLDELRTMRQEFEAKLDHERQLHAQGWESTYHQVQGVLDEINGEIQIRQEQA